jgi:glycosyltransferase involved in cell wall biosynthesis
VRVALLSFRLGGTDGVSVVARTWTDSLRRLGHEVVTVAGTGHADRLVPGLGWPQPDDPPDPAAVDDALADAGLVVVENLLSLPLNPPAATVVAGALRDRPAILHHHDLAWQREGLDRPGWPPTDPAWRHVTVNDFSKRELAERGIDATTIRSAFDVDEPPGDRAGTRRTLDVADGELLLLHPVRAIARKRIPAAIELAEALGATYWLTGPPEEGYDRTLAALLRHARTRTIHRPFPTTTADAYAAADAVAFPSAWEGFGNPFVEAAIHRRALATSRSPAARELARLGFQWFDAADPASLAHALRAPDERLHDRNASVARRHFSFRTLDSALSVLLDEAG